MSDEQAHGFQTPLRQGFVPFEYLVCETLIQGGILVASRWLIRWILNIVGIILTASIYGGLRVTLLGAIAGSILLGLVNAVIRPVILILSLPINILTLGLFTLLINGFMLWLVGQVVRGFEVQSFGAAVIAALVLMVISSLISFVVHD
jgi:putative membrane protein